MRTSDIKIDGLKHPVDDHEDEHIGAQTGLQWEKTEMQIGNKLSKIEKRLYLVLVIEQKGQQRNWRHKSQHRPP